MAKDSVFYFNNCFVLKLPARVKLKNLRLYKSCSKIDIFCYINILKSNLFGTTISS